MVIAGNQMTSVNGFIASGKITGYGGTGNVTCNYNGTANTTTITATQGSAPSATQLIFPYNYRGTNLVLSWPTSSAYYGLQSTTNLIAPVVWKSLTNIVITASGTNNVILPLSSQTAFFSLNHGIDATTMNGKLLMGYQGWFACPNDGSAPNQWWHWFHNQTPTAANVNTDFLPDISGVRLERTFQHGDDLFEWQSGSVLFGRRAKNYASPFPMDARESTGRRISYNVS